MDKKSLLVTTALIGMSLMGYGRRAYGACSAVGPAVTCTGTTAAAQTFSPLDNATVTVNGDFDNTVAAGNGLYVKGAGALSFTDNNTVNSVVISGGGGGNDGVYFNTTGDDGGTPGSLDIDSNSDITGANHGLIAWNYGTGTTSVTVNGDVTGTANAGVWVMPPLNKRGFK